MQPTQEWQRGFVLHRRPYSESSLLVDFFTEQNGRLTLLAKGARATRSPLKSLLQPFTPLLLRWSGRGELKTLTKAEAISITLPLTHNALYSGFYLNELITRALEPQTAYPELFREYLLAISQLAQGQALEPILRRFEFCALRNLGYGIRFDQCAATGKPVEPEMRYQYRENQGFIASLLQNQTAFSGQALLDFSTLSFHSPETLSEAKRFTRLALKPFIGSAPLKSRELFSSVLPNNLKVQ